MNRNSLLFKIQNSKFFNSLTLVFRNLRTRRGVDKYRKNFRFKFSKGKFVLLVIGGLLIFFIFFNLSKYFQIKFDTYLDQENLQALQSLKDFKEVNTLVIGFDDTQNTHKFVNMLAIVSLDYQTASLKVYNLNPNYIATINNNATTLRTSYNFLTSPNENKMSDLMMVVEDISAVRIDRYIAFDYSDVNKLIELTSLGFVADKSYRIGDDFISQGEYLERERLANFVTFDKIPEDDTIQRHSMFIRELFENLRDNFALYRYFLNAEEFSKVVYTNFTKDEFLRFIINVSSTDSSIRTGFASKKLTLGDLTKIDLEAGIRHSDMMLDENIANLFVNIPIIKEQGKLEIFNATDQSGVAYKLKRKFENTGITVIKTGNYPDNIDENLLYIPKNNPDNFENTIRIIRSILRNDLRIIYGDYKFNYSGDMILVIGKF